MIRRLVSFGLILVAEGFGIPLPKLLIEPVHSLESEHRATGNETGNGVVGFLITIATRNNVVVGSIVGLIAWLPLC